MGRRIDSLLERNTRLWMGASVRAWIGMLRRHGLRFGARRAHLAGLVTLYAPINSLAGWLGDRLFVRPRSEGPTPIFILGHWRSGTTLLHQLLSLDPRFAFPTTWECAAPHLSLWLSEGAARFLPMRVPRSRPFDRVEIGWQSPQEDEVALGNMGTPSPYEWFAFPASILDERRRAGFAYCAREVPVAATLRRFLARVMSRRRRGLCRSQPTAPTHIVLKSPTHTSRVAELRRAFPTARFIRIQRDPYTVFSSSRKLWTRLTDHQGLQAVDFEAGDARDALDEHILAAHEEMHDAFDQDVGQWRREGDDIDQRFAEITYDAIDPTSPENAPEQIVERLTEIYRRLGLVEANGAPPAETVAAWRGFLSDQASYEKNQFSPLTADERAAVTARWVPRYPSARVASA